MTELRVRSFPELTEELSRYSPSGTQEGRWLFRGHSSARWKLVPKAGRASWWSDARDLRVFDAWRDHAVQYSLGFAESEWESLAIAQHHGLATRLLDWSRNPLAAVFFALWEVRHEDAAIYVLRHDREVITSGSDMRQVAGIAVYRPRDVAQRITRQISEFTIHNPPHLPLDETTVDGELHTIIVDRAARARLLRELDFYGMNRFALFPDLDGLSAHLNWRHTPDEFGLESLATVIDINNTSELPAGG